MGLTSWKGGEVRKTDVATAKNYLKEEEIDELNRIVTMWLDFAEDQAKRRKQVFMVVTLNRKLFPLDFMFPLTREEIRDISQIVMSSGIKRSMK